MPIIETFQKIFSLPDLRKRILIVAGLLLLTRVLAHIPLPSVDITALRAFFNQSQVFGLLNMFSGGSMENFSIIMMGVGPYITSSIIFQLLTVLIPALDEINKEGESGREKINYWTRILTVPLAVIQSYAMVHLLQSQNILPALTAWQWSTILVSITAGSMLLMWIGELISENGIGNGVSLIISLGIIAGVPAQFGQTLTILDTINIFSLIIFAVVAVLVVAGIILANEGTRQIPVSYARRARGLKAYGGVDTHLPIRVNSAGVIPIIFGMSILIFPGIIGQFLKNVKTEALADFGQKMVLFFQPNTLRYGIVYFVLIVLFTYFYTGIIFQPNQMAENLQKQGGFIPGIRPGRETENYLARVIGHLTLGGALFLGVIAILPYAVQQFTHISTMIVGGTGVLIVVSVIIETMRQVQAQLAMTTYENY